MTTTIALHYWAGAKAAAGTDYESWPANSVAAALTAAETARNDPHFSRVLSVCSVLLDGVVLRPADLTLPREQPITVEILPPFAGGASASGPLSGRASLIARQSFVTTLRSPYADHRDGDVERDSERDVEARGPDAPPGR
jgi:sulfur-carrier protein